MDSATKDAGPPEGSEIWVVAEHFDGDITEVTLELVCEARRLASKLGSVSILMVGKEAIGLTSRLGNYGADRVLLLDTVTSPGVSLRSIAHVFGNLIRTCLPRVVLIPYWLLSSLRNCLPATAVHVPDLCLWPKEWYCAGTRLQTL